MPDRRQGQRRPQGKGRPRTAPLSQGDFERLQAAILALHSQRDLRALREALPGIFLGLIEADYFALGDFRIDPARRLVKVLNVWESRPMLVGDLLAAAERNMFDHPFMQHALRSGPVSGALKLSDFLTLPQLRSTRLYRELLRPANVGRLMSVYSLGGPGMASLSLMRAETKSDFTERDRALFELLRPHFDLARANIERESALRVNRSNSLKAAGFTPREIEVALWLGQGKTNAEVALILAMLVRTVEKHVEHILRKLGAVNRAAAAVAIDEFLRA